MIGKRVKTTKYEIIQVASEFFLSEGYSATSPKMIANVLGISTGNITYYFPTKEHLLLEIVELFYEFQWEMIKEQNGKGADNISSICFETVMIVNACANNELARDFCISVFQSEMCLNYLRKKHEERAKIIFAKECAMWNDEQFAQAELMVKGLQYISVIPSDANVSFDKKVSATLNLILSIYNVEEAVRQAEIEKALSIHYKSFGRTAIQQFLDYVEYTNIRTLENMLRGNRRKAK